MERTRWATGCWCRRSLTFGLRLCDSSFHDTGCARNLIAGSIVSLDVLYVMAVETNFMSFRGPILHEARLCKWIIEKLWRHRRRQLLFHVLLLRLLLRQLKRLQKRILGWNNSGRLLCDGGSGTTSPPGSGRSDRTGNRAR